MQRLTETLGQQFIEAEKLDEAIRGNLRRLGYEL